MKIKQNVLEVHSNLSKLEMPSFIDSMDLFEGTKEIYIEHGCDKYILKINDRNELELLPNSNALH